eukprot:COSAG02_NODE_2121_length_9774_cov_3.757003_6_plen_485_part_00
MQLTFTVPLNEEAVGYEAFDGDGEGFSTLSENMVEMSVLTPHPGPSGWRKHWHKTTAALLVLLFVVILVVGIEDTSIVLPASGQLVDQQPPPLDDGPTAACIDNSRAWGPGGTPGGGAWTNSKGQGCDVAKCGRIEEEAWGLSADAACCKCGGGRLADSGTPPLISPDTHLCTDVTYDEMENACIKTSNRYSKHMVGPYSCSPDCKALLSDLLMYCVTPVERWPAYGPFAEYLDLDHSLDTGVENLAKRTNTLSLRVLNLVRVHHNISRHDGRPTVVPDAVEVPGCPEGVGCFQLSNRDEVYVVIDTSPLAMAPFNILSADARVSSFVRDEEERLAKVSAYEKANVELSKCIVPPIERLAAKRDGVRNVLGLDNARGFPNMDRYCSPVCGEASTFGPTAFDIDYFPKHGEVNTGSMGLRITSESPIPLNYADIRLEVTVALSKPGQHPSRPGEANTYSIDCQNISRHAALLRLDLPSLYPPFAD